MKKRFLFLVLFSFLIAAAPASAGGVWQSFGFSSSADPGGFETIREKIIEGLMRPDVEEDRIATLISTLRKDGSWPGIDYVDTSRTGFEHSVHMSNLVSLSRAYQQKESGFYKDKKLKAAFSAALDYWLANDFICANWWWNQIGVPGRMVNVLLLMGKENFTEKQWEGALQIAGRAHLEASGARPSGDRIVIAGILAKKLLAAGDSVQFGEVIQVIEGEIKFSTGRGMQYDYSFHHRNDRVNNTLSYGTSYASAFSEWAAYVAGTDYAFSPEPLKQLIDYYLDGICKMLAYGKYPDPGAKNRGVSRSGALRAIGAGIPQRLLQASRYRADELERIVAIREGKDAAEGKDVAPFLHSTFFWHSEHFTHQRPEYYTSVRMFSTRNHNMEVPYNSEGLLNHYLGNGSNFISRTGTEYYNIFPVFDYHKIPGATLVQYPDFPDPDEIQQAGITDFVGGITNGTFGAAAFDFKSTHDSIQAKKAWFFFDGKYACLGADISSPAGSPVATTVNQCLLKPGTIVMAGGKRTRPGKGEHVPDRLSWVWHDSIGYIFPDFQEVHLSNQAQTGSWYRISQQADSPKEQISRDIFKLWINHGRRPDKATYAYFVIPGASEKETARFNPGKDLTILANSPDLQAVEDPEAGLVQMAFYAPGTVTTSQNLVVTAENPGMLMIKSNRSGLTAITAADPSRKLTTFRFSINTKFEASGEHFTARWDPEKERTEITVSLPEGVYAGESVTTMGSL